MTRKPFNSKKTPLTGQNNKGANSKNRDNFSSGSKPLNPSAPWVQREPKRPLRTQNGEISSHQESFPLNAVVGLNAVLAALQNRGPALKRLIISDAERHPNSTFKTILETLKTLGHRYQTVPAATFKRFAPAAHQGIAAFFEEINPLDLEDFLKTIPLEGPYLIVALDRVEDPGNFGALFRSAWSLGAKAIFTAKDRAAALTPQALKAASGAVEKLPWVKVTNLVAAFSKLKELGFWVVGADSQDSGESLFDFKFPLRSVLVLGAEGKGLSRLTREKADYLVQIPLAGKSDSLNVASAGAIFLYAYRSQTRDA